MRVLAVDPGYGRCGIAVLEKTTGRDRLIFSTCLETPKEAEFADRLGYILSAIESAVDDMAPEAFAMERLFFNTNRTTAMHVAEVRGAIIALAQRRGLRVHEYMPSEIKSAAAGDGRADKNQVARMVRMLVTIERDITRDDEYDAIAIGMTHLARARLPMFR